MHLLWEVENFMFWYLRYSSSQTYIIIWIYLQCYLRPFQCSCGESFIFIQHLVQTGAAVAIEFHRHKRCYWKLRNRFCHHVVTKLDVSLMPFKNYRLILGFCTNENHSNFWFVSLLSMKYNILIKDFIAIAQCKIE